MIPKTENTLADADECNKQLRDRKVRFSLTLKKGKMVHIDNKPNSKKSDAEKLSGAVRSK